MHAQRQSGRAFRTVLVLLATSFRHATAEIVKEVLVLAYAFNVDGVAAAKARRHACAGAIGQAPDASSFMQAQWLWLAPEAECLSFCAQQCRCVEKTDSRSHNEIEVVFPNKYGRSV